MVEIDWKLIRLRHLLAWRYRSMGLALSIPKSNPAFPTIIQRSFASNRRALGRGFSRNYADFEEGSSA